MLLTDLAYPPAWRDQAAETAQALLDHDMYLVCAHSRLDGDALSSMAALGYFLEQQHKQYVLFAPFGVPEMYDFLLLPAPVYKSLSALPFRPRNLVALDCGEPGRLGEELQEELQQDFADFGIINIDHHPGTGMGTVSTLVAPDASSTTQILACVLHMANARLTPELASCLALGLVTDTGGFRHANITPGVFALAALLEEAGASIHRMRERLEKIWSMPRFRLWGHMSERVELHNDGQFALVSVSLDHLEKDGAVASDTEGFVEHMRELRTVKVAAFVREQSLEVCKFSLRSTEDVDVNAIAVSLGGGGHRNAAGGTLIMSLDKAAALLAKSVQAALSRKD